MKQRQIGVHLSEDEMRRVTGAEKTAFHSPVPTQVVSNGEYNPLPQTEQQRQVEGLIKEYAETYGQKQGLDRRRFLKSASGMAAAFLAMNKVFGPVWEVSEAEAADPDMADARAHQLSKQFIFDDQTHFVRDDFDKEGLLGLGKYAAKHWNPAMLDPKRGVPLTLPRYKMENYLKEIFLDSDTKIALLSGAPFDDPTWWLLSNDADRGGAQLGEQDRRLAAHAGPHRVHAQLARLDGRGRSRHRRAQARRLEVLHHRRPALAVVQVRLAAGRREADVSVLREGVQVRHQQHLHPQGPDAARLREVVAGTCGSTPP